MNFAECVLEIEVKRLREAHAFILIGKGGLWWQWACTCGEWCAVAYPAGHGKEEDKETLHKVYSCWEAHLHKPRSEWFTDWRDEDFAVNIWQAMDGRKEGGEGK